MNGGDVNALFPVNHNEKFLHLEDVEEFEEDWTSELDHLEGLLASKAKFVTRVDWKNPEFPCHMPHDIHFLLREGDITHLNNILEDDQNDFKYFHQLGLLPAFLQVALEGSDDAHKYRRIPRVHINLHSNVPMSVKIFSPRMGEARSSGTPMFIS
jgi:hypothetical protein